MSDSAVSEVKIEDGKLWYERRWFHRGQVLTPFAVCSVTDFSQLSPSWMKDHLEFKVSWKKEPNANTLVYQDQLANIKKQLQQLRDFSHPEYNRRLKKIEMNYKDRLRTNALWRDHCIEVVEKEYVGEKRIAVKEFEEKKIELRENLIVDLEEKRKLIEAERHSIELTECQIVNVVLSKSQRMSVQYVSGDAVSVKKTTDGSKFRIFVSQLAKGKFSIKRRAAS
ncbi:uncharacterized protein LOC103517880 [Diaphorina citri]|uniref:Uncharacterized protein LOC103517880 n=1 Tax=Diaphorina citri TaxID=121845 RepID=A0A1S3DGG2_DIACI|nr:uncharacterized protein LOC103517880 [Diaphorina citri]